MFKALLISKADDGAQTVALQSLDESALPDADVDLRVLYSTINYKDALAISGRAPIVRSYPMVPGIDLVGEVLSSRDPRYAAGAQLLLNGWGVGEKHWGGLAQRARLSGDWLIALPAGLTAKQSMQIGTAGYTAMLCVMALESRAVTPASGPILVTGANGGVGSFAVMLLAALGFEVIAATGRVEQAEHLRALGAAQIIDRAELSQPGRPLGKERWAGAIDSVGSHTLANACAGTRYGGSVAACGLAQGADFPSSVMPFILRGVSLLGVDSVMRPRADRELAWSRLASLLDPDRLALNTACIGLGDVIPHSADLLDGKVRGRLVVDVNRD